MRSSKSTKRKKKGSQLLLNKIKADFDYIFKVVEPIPRDPERYNSKEQNVLYKLPTQIKLKIKHRSIQV